MNGKLKRAVDVLMTAALLFLMGYQFWGVYDYRAATKITNLGAVKIVLGIRRFALYIVYVILFSLLAGLMVNAVI